MQGAVCNRGGNRVEQSVQEKETKRQAVCDVVDSFYVHAASESISFPQHLFCVQSRPNGDRDGDDDTAREDHLPPMRMITMQSRRYRGSIFLSLKSISHRYARMYAQTAPMVCDPSLGEMSGDDTVMGLCLSVN